MQGQFEVLRLIADFAILLMSMTIPTYAISVSFLGKEHSRVMRKITEEREKAEEELKERIKTGAKLEDIEQRINEFRRKEKEIKGIVRPLSLLSIVILPSIFFGLALFVTAFAMLTYPSNTNLFYVGTIILIAVGLIAFGRALVGIHKVARELEGGKI